MIDYFPNLVIVKVHEAPSLIFSFCTLTKVIVYITKSTTFPESSLALFFGSLPFGSKIFWSLCALYIF